MKNTTRFFGLGKMHSRGHICLLLLTIGVLTSVVLAGVLGLDGGGLWIVVFTVGIFAVLAASAIVPSVPLAATIGASVACVLTMIGPFGYAIYSSLNDNGGGANIGAG